MSHPIILFLLLSLFSSVNSQSNQNRTNDSENFNEAFKNMHWFHRSFIVLVFGWLVFGALYVVMHYWILCCTSMCNVMRRRTQIHPPRPQPGQQNMIRMQDFGPIDFRVPIAPIMALIISYHILMVDLMDRWEVHALG